MMGVFASLDLVLFFVFWEVMLIPMYFLIGIWGHERRVYAAIKWGRSAWVRGSVNRLRRWLVHNGKRRFRGIRATRPRVPAW